MGSWVDRRKGFDFQKWRRHHQSGQELTVEEEEEEGHHARPTDPIQPHHPLSGTTYPPTSQGGQGAPCKVEAQGTAPIGCWGQLGTRLRQVPEDGEQEEEKDREPHPRFLGQHRRDRHHVWPPRPQGTRDSLYLEAVPRNLISAGGDARHKSQPPAPPHRQAERCFLLLFN